MFANIKVFHHLGKSHIEQVEQQRENELSSIQKEQIMDVMFTNAKVLHHLGEKSHNFEKVEQLT